MGCLHQAMAGIENAAERVGFGTRRFIELGCREPQWGWTLFHALWAMPELRAQMLAPRAAISNAALRKDYLRWRSTIYAASWPAPSYSTPCSRGLAVMPVQKLAPKPPSYSYACSACRLPRPPALSHVRWHNYRSAQHDSGQASPFELRNGLAFTLPVRPFQCMIKDVFIHSFGRAGRIYSGPITIRLLKRCFGFLTEYRR
jgi:hypothetical protein